ncbi:hypothetical protein ACUXV3_08635 [Roseobacteraceae bacterium NS-SX3]
MPRTRLLLFCAASALLAAAACTRVPELEDRLGSDLRAAGYPELIPLDENVAPLPDPAGQSAALKRELDARSARLQARAAALKSVDP